MRRYFYGGPGTGKSVVVNASDFVLQECVQIMSFVGKAAFHVNGRTIHSVLGIPVPFKGDFTLSQEAQQNLHERLKDVRYFIVDEISTVSQQLFVWIHKRLNQAFYNNDLEEKQFGKKM